MSRTLTPEQQAKEEAEQIARRKAHKYERVLTGGKDIHREPLSKLSRGELGNGMKDYR